MDGIDLVISPPRWGISARLVATSAIVCEQVLFMNSGDAAGGVGAESRSARQAPRSWLLGFRSEFREPRLVPGWFLRFVCSEGAGLGAGVSGRRQ